MPAALFMALTRTLVRAAVIETSSPAEALGRVNDLLLPDTQQGMFVTAVYGELDLMEGRFTYVNAGHNPPFLVKGSQVEKLTRTAVALGVMEQPNIRENTLSLSNGDTVFLYTDGLTEAFSDDGDLFGDERVMNALKSAQTGSVEDVIVAVEDCLNEFIGTTPLGDDLTMLVIKKAVD